MAKKKQKSKTIQMLSPEKYIMQKARTLPIHQCWINTDWEEEKLANVIVARKHTNGNFTLGSYLIDLQCLGIKDTQYLFNISSAEYRDLLDHYRKDFDIELAGYTLVHNIIFAGLEYAEEYGFKPHKDFKLTQNILEEDTDDVELIEIECGNNGKPLYISGPFDSEVRSREIIAQLEKTAGPGNFDFITNIGGFENNEEDQDDDNEFNRFDNMGINERLALLSERMENIEGLSDGEKAETGELVQSVIDDYLDHEIADKLYEGFLKEAVKIEITNEINDDFIFGAYSPKSNSPELKMELEGLYEQLYTDTKKAAKKIKKLQKNYPKTPYLYFLELVMLRTDHFSKYETALPVYAKQFPEYSLIRILKDISLLNTEDSIVPDFSFEKAIPHYFSGRKKIHTIELFNLFMLLLFRAMASANMEETDAIDYLTDEFDMNEGDIEVLTQFITMAKITLLASLAEENGIVPFDDEDDGYSNYENEAGYSNKNGKNSETFQFKIQIKNITHPPVWRKIKVPSVFSFDDFHYAIQISFGWENAHLFEFSQKGHRSWPVIKQKFDDGLDDFEFNQGEKYEPQEITLSEIFKNEKQKFTYTYDFGDTWEHEIILEKIETGNLMYPKIVSGKGQCPPEDCGGPWGYMQMKETLENPKDPEYKNYREWLGLAKNEKWDPAYYDLEYHQKSLIEFFRKN